MKSAITDAIAVLGDKQISKDERIARLSSLYLKYFDVRFMAMFALGPYARNAAGSQRDEYVDALKRYMVTHYFVRLEGVGHHYAVEKSFEQGEDTVMVETKVGSYAVVWRVRNRDGGLKVVDVIVEGTSLLLVQRNDFGDLLHSNNGDISQLVAMMHTEGQVGVYHSTSR